MFFLLEVEGGGGGRFGGFGVWVRIVRGIGGWEYACTTMGDYYYYYPVYPCQADQRLGIGISPRVGFGGCVHGRWHFCFAFFFFVFLGGVWAGSRYIVRYN